MKNLFNSIPQEEKNRILNLHEMAIKKHYLIEQPVDSAQPIAGPKNLIDSGAIVKKGVPPDTYIYAKLGDEYYYSKMSDGNTPNWILATSDKSIRGIKSKIYNEKVPVIKTVKPPVKIITKTPNVPGKDDFKLNRDVRTFDVVNTRVGTGRDRRLDIVGPSIVKTPQEEKSLFDRITGGIKQFVTNVVSFAIPIHYRIFYDFLSLRRQPFTATDMSNEEQEALKQMIQYGFKHGFKNGGNMDFYDIANKLNAGSEQINFKNKENLGLNQFRIKSEYTKLSMTLGNATVTKSGNNYIVTDLYDFNNYQNNPEKYTLKEVPITVKDSIKKVASGNLVQGIEQMASYYQKLGYSGIPVDIELPV